MPKKPIHRCYATLVGAALIATFTPVGSTALAFEKARSADQFVDSIGINTHFGYQDSLGVPYSDYVTTKKVLTDIGFRHIRDSSDIHASSAKLWMQDTYRTLYADTGIKTTFPTQPNYGATVKDLMQAIARVTPVALDAVEGPNEPDNTAIGGIGNAAAVNWMNSIYPAIKSSSDPAIRQIPVIGPSPINGYASLAPLNSMDYQNMHSYPGSGMPSGSLYDGTNPGNISNANHVVGNGNPTKPLYPTETGYEIGTQGNGVSEKAAGKYTPRLFAEYFNAGIPRTMLYQLFQSGEVSHGLVVVDTWNGKRIGNYHYRPAATALKNLIATLQESGTSIANRQQKGASFSPGWLDYTLSGPLQKAEFYGGSNIHHLLLQKSDGDFYLLLWNEVSSWNWGKDVTNTPVPVTVSLKTAISSAIVYTQNDSGSYSSSTARLSGSAGGQSVKVSVHDSMVILKLKPSGGLSSTQKNGPRLRTLQGINLSGTVRISTNITSGNKQVYQTNSHGITTYNATGLRFSRNYGGDAYKVRLQFASTSQVGSRKADAYLNGLPVVSNLQGNSGAGNTAVGEFWSFANSNGKLISQFLAGMGKQPQVKGVEVLYDGSTSVTDNLKDWSKTHSHTGNWSLNNVKDGGNKVVDGATAVKNNDSTTDSIVWKYSGIKDFYAYAYDFQNGTWDSSLLQFYVSPDGVKWTPVLVKCHRVSDVAGQVYNTAIVQYELSPVALLPSGTSYLKYEIRSGAMSSGGFGLGYVSLTYTDRD